MTSAAHQRLDKWLWHARVVRTRSSASKLIEGGLVRLNGSRATQAAHAVKAGDVLTIALDARVRVLRIEGMASRRGDAAAARALYAELT
jgi:ribosome-associated heat shock protein Hsp15